MVQSPACWAAAYEAGCHVPILDVHANQQVLGMCEVVFPDHNIIVEQHGICHNL